ncbi:MAG: MBL fold metallo-hydrolase [Oscillospiraceae bacterium]|nr:MBL fold metallo-hydrolase [Oscillospiraceae bacterium]
MEYKNTVTLLGTRGSMPCSGKEYLRYGGRTTCILVQLASETLLLDGGSGMAFLKAESVPLRRLSILLTHAHVDHLLGLPMSPILAKKNVTVDLYAATRDGRSGEQ